MQYNNNIGLPVCITGTYYNNGNSIVKTGPELDDNDKFNSYTFYLYCTHICLVFEILAKINK